MYYDRLNVSWGGIADKNNINSRWELRIRLCLYNGNPQKESLSRLKSAGTEYILLQKRLNNFTRFNPCRRCSDRYKVLFSKKSATTNGNSYTPQGELYCSMLLWHEVLINRDINIKWICSFVIICIYYYFVWYHYKTQSQITEFSKTTQSKLDVIRSFSQEKNFQIIKDLYVAQGVEAEISKPPRVTIIEIIYRQHSNTKKNKKKQLALFFSLILLGLVWTENYSICLKKLSTDCATCLAWVFIYGADAEISRTLLSHRNAIVNFEQFYNDYAIECHVIDTE